MIIRKAIGIFIAAIVGFLLIAAAGLYWAAGFLNARTSVMAPSVLETKTMRVVNVYFGNSNLNQGMMDCALVFPVSREINNGQDAPTAAVQWLLSGPTEDEIKSGYGTSINNGVRVKSVFINNGEARVDFDYKMEEGMGGSCRVGAIRSQIERTLLQFPNIQSVKIGVEGNFVDPLQP